MGSEDRSTTRPPTKDYAPKLGGSSYDNLENYIAALGRAKDLNLFENEKILIYASIVASGKEEWFSALTQDQYTVDEFAKFLRTNFGLSGTDLRRQVRNSRQEIGESPGIFLGRIERNYFRTKKQFVPGKVDIEDWEKEDIRDIFINGLRDNEIKKKMRFLEKMITYDELAAYATQFSQANQDTFPQL